MSWLKRSTGLDWFDLVIHVGVTAMFMAFIGVSDGPEEVMPLIAAGSLVLLGVRRHGAMKRLAAGSDGLTTGQMTATRIDDMEQRLAELEAVQGRIAELEERLDFAERLLAQSSAEHKALGGG